MFITCRIDTYLHIYICLFTRPVTGAAGVGGALSYAFLINIGFSPKSTLLLMLLVPFIQFISFFVVLKESNDDSTISSITSSTTSLIHHTSADDGVAIIQPPLNIKQKLEYLPNMMKYVLPLFAVYVCEYFINQGLVSVFGLIAAFMAQKKIISFSFSVRVNLLSEHWHQSWRTVPMVASDIPNRSIRIAFVSQHLPHKFHMADVLAPVR